MTVRQIAAGLAALAAVAMLLGLGLVLGGSPSLVDWRSARAVVIESDDWGLCGYVPAATALEGLDLAGLSAGEIPAVYLNSTLEDSAAVVALAAVLAAGRGRDGGPAVLQPNYIMGWLVAPTSTGPADSSDFRRGTLPDLPPVYARPGLWRAVADAVAADVWYPEYHGLWHYVPEDRFAACDHDPIAASAARRGILLFPGSTRSFELNDGRSLPTLAAELATGLSAFAGLFGREPDAVIAPDYHWSRRHERLWRDAGLTVVQSQREQRHPDYEGKSGRLRKVLARSLRRWSEQRLTYLDRNVRLETAQIGDPAEATARAERRVRRAWRRGEPAIVESHRVNYAHLDPAVASDGRAALGALLAALDGEPLYLTDVEVARLSRGGTSWRRTAVGLRVRNLTHARRPVVLPGHRLIFLDAGESRLVSTADFGPPAQGGD
ncbi:MAG: hypothetical protein Q7W29_03065 [bacterium]|nr:hypothetical protein [bacterium]